MRSPRSRADSPHWILVNAAFARTRWRQPIHSIRRRNAAFAKARFKARSLFAKVMQFPLQPLIVLFNFGAEDREQRVPPQITENGEQGLAARLTALADQALRGADVRAGDGRDPLGRVAAIFGAVVILQPLAQQFLGIQNLDLHVSLPP